jgi:hypothetical protein
MRIQFTAALLAVAISVASRASAADFTLKFEDKAPPKEIGETIRSVLESKALGLVKDGKPALEIWLRQEAPLKSKPAAASEALNAIAETTLLGAVAVHESSLRDYKDNPIPKGLYTARFGLQPKDGDHLGTAEFDFFLILTDVQHDKELNGLNAYKPLVKASGKSTSSGHPLIVSLRPASGEGTVPRLAEPADAHKSIRIKIPGKTAGAEKADLIFDLIYQGHGHIQ